MTERIFVYGIIFSVLSSQNSYFLSAKRRFRNVLIFSHFSLSSENSYALAALSKFLLAPLDEVALAPALTPPGILCIGFSSILVIPFFIAPRFFDIMRLLRWFSNRTRFELVHEFDGIGAGPTMLLLPPLLPPPPSPPQVITSSSKWLPLLFDGKYFSFGTGSVSHSAKSAMIVSTIFLVSMIFVAAAGAIDSAANAFAVFSLFILSALSTGFLNGTLADIQDRPNSSVGLLLSTYSWYVSLFWTYLMSIDLANGFIGRFKSKSTWTIWNSPLATISILSMHCKLTNGLNAGSLSARQYFVCIVRLHLMHKNPQRFTEKWNGKKTERKIDYYLFMHFKRCNSFGPLTVKWIRIIIVAHLLTIATA